MCGIAGWYCLNDKYPITLLEKLTNELMDGISKRGGDATGLLAIKTGGGVVIDKHNIPVHEFHNVRSRLDDDVRGALLHTRLATIGAPEEWANNHPVSSGTTFVVHNGHIYNHKDVFRDLNVDRIGEVDSEAIAASLDVSGLDNYKPALERLQGGFAIAAVNPVTHPEQVLLAKGPTYPLVYVMTDNLIVWASTFEAIHNAWRKTFGPAPSVKQFKVASEGDVINISPTGVNLHTAAFVSTSIPKNTWGGWSNGSWGAGTKLLPKRVRKNLKKQSKAGLDEMIKEASREYDIHRETLKQTAEKLDLPESFVFWVMFLANLNSGNTREIYEEINDIYYDIEGSIYEGTIIDAPSASVVAADDDDDDDDNSILLGDTDFLLDGDGEIYPLNMVQDVGSSSWELCACGSVRRSNERCSCGDDDANWNDDWSANLKRRVSL
jgi:glucosamine 6-phosphate synthetase-like amidotransferase/phosphosugar isomerase protein